MKLQEGDTWRAIRKLDLKLPSILIIFFLKRLCSQHSDTLFLTKWVRRRFRRFSQLLLKSQTEVCMWQPCKYLKGQRGRVLVAVTLQSIFIDWNLEKRMLCSESWLELLILTFLRSWPSRLPQNSSPVEVRRKASLPVLIRQRGKDKHFSCSVWWWVKGSVALFSHTGAVPGYLCVFDGSFPISATRISASAWCPVKGEETSSRLVGNTWAWKLTGNSWQCQYWQQFLFHLSSSRNVTPCSHLPLRMGLIHFSKLAANPHTNYMSHSCTHYQQRWGGEHSRSLRGWVRRDEAENSHTRGFMLWSGK